MPSATDPGTGSAPKGPFKEALRQGSDGRVWKGMEPRDGGERKEEEGRGEEEGEGCANLIGTHHMSKKSLQMTENRPLHFARLAGRFLTFLQTREPDT